MKSNTLFPTLAAAVVSLTWIHDSLHAQSAPQPAPNSTQEQPIELSPFTVDASRDVGYLANNTLAGSRLNTSLRDTPAAISVLTPEFLSDIGAFTLGQAVGYAVNVETDVSDSDELGSEGGNEKVMGFDGRKYRVRGLRATTARNYFAWDLATETSLIERIEDSRGPNSVLFGLASPGGLLNANTKQALLARSFRKASLTVGSFDSWRGTFDYNQPVLDGKAAFRLNTVYNKTNSFRHWEFEEHMRVHLTGTYRLTTRTRLRAEFEHGQIDSNSPRTHTLNDNVLQWLSRGRPTFATLPDAATRTANGLTQLSTAAAQARVTYIGNNDTVVAMRGALITTGNNWVITDTRIADYSIHVGGPGQDRTSRFNIYSAFLEHQFSRTTFLELAFNHGDHVFMRYDPRPGGSNTLKGDPQQLLPTGAVNPFAGQLLLESNWIQLPGRTNSDAGRATLSQEFDAGKWGNYRVAALGEYEKYSTKENPSGQIWVDVGSSRVDLQACKLEYSIVSPK